jgi:formate dehydrogenase major subunit
MMSLKLTIDGRQIEAAPGTTNLDAARQLGIEIPTLCHLEGITPYGSCFLCVVRVEGRDGLVPSCVAPVENGMVVTTSSEEIREARKTALELLLSEHLGDCETPCTLACPAHMDISALNTAITRGEADRAIRIAKAHIPFPASIGRICARYCERACRRADLDEPIAICALKRFAGDSDSAASERYIPPLSPATGKTVAIIGAGPAGLTAAYYLQQWGHKCTVFESCAQPGGMLRYGVPEFRLPKAALDAEINSVLRVGVELRLRTRVGVDVSFADLRSRCDAVFVAVGAQKESPVNWPGAELAMSALSLLERVAVREHPRVGDSVIVIGDGIEALDAARTAVRLGARAVILMCEADPRRDPFLREHFDAAKAEGIIFEQPATAVSLQRTSAGRLALEWQRADGRFMSDASCVVVAPKRRAVTEPLQKLDIPCTPQGVAADRKTLATSLPGVFAGGDAVSGPGAAIRAVAAGRQAALSIHRYLTGASLAGDVKPINSVMGKLSEDDRAAYLQGFQKADRAQLATIEANRRRTGFAEVQAGMNADVARQEAQRCLHCDCLAKDECKLRLYATEFGADPRRLKGERRRFDRDNTHPQIVYESGKCILCGLCVRIAEQCGERAPGLWCERPGLGFTNRGFATRVAVPFGATVADGLPSIAERCARACPTGALALKKISPRSGRNS